MEKTIQLAKRELIWVNIIFFTVTTLVGLIGAPIYYFHFGLSLSEWCLFLFYIAATGMSITVGYHRLFAHRTFKANPLVEFLVLFFGAAAFEQSALRWASQHRDHHRFVDTDQDPYSIKKGFFYAHIGWLIFWRHPAHLENARDLQKNKLVMSQNNFYILWASVAGIILPVMLGALSGHALGAFIFTVCLRLTFVYHSTFCINSVCHMFGKATYDIYSTAKDHWFVAFLTFGEGYHNFHHHFPGDYRNAVRWYQWDPSKWTIFCLKFLGLASDLKRVSNFRILEARLTAQNQSAQDMIAKKIAHPHLEESSLKLRQAYKDLKHQLIQWEIAAKNYQAMVYKRVSHQATTLRSTAFTRVELAKQQFRESQKRWETVHLRPLGLAKA